jgi:hypothetical protein
MSVATPWLHGPIVVPNVQVESVFYGQAWTATSGLVVRPGGSPSFSAQQNIRQINTYLSMITHSGFMDQLGQYGVGRGSFMGSDIPLNGPASSTTVTEAQITGMLDTEIRSYSVPGPNADRLYIVFLPPNVKSARDVSNSAVGHHDSFVDSNGQTVYYAVIPHPTGNLVLTGSLHTETTFQYQTEAVSHELAEAVTDPVLTDGWTDRTSGSATFGDEIGDIPQDTLPKDITGNVLPGYNCVGNYQGYMVQQLWSNSANASVLPPSGNATWSPHDGWVSSITTVTGNDGNGYIFGIGGDSGVYMKSQQPDGTYSGWTNIGYPYHFVNGRYSTFGAKSLVATTDAHGWRLFAIGMDGVSYTRGATESSWTFLGGVCLQLAVGHDASGRLDLYAIGTDNRVYEMSSTGWGTAGFGGAYYTLVHPRNDTYSFDVPVTSIVVGYNTDGRQQIFGTTTWYGDVWEIEQTAPNSGWGEWNGLSSLPHTKQLTLGTTTDGRLELFAIGSNNALYTMRQTLPDSWSGSAWACLGGYVKQITVGRNQDGREEVFAIGSDNTVYAKMEAAADDNWTDSDWFQVSNQTVKALATVYNSNFFGSIAYDELTLAAIMSDGSLATTQQTNPNGGWY